MKTFKERVNYVKSIFIISIVISIIFSVILALIHNYSFKELILDIVIIQSFQILIHFIIPDAIKQMKFEQLFRITFQFISKFGSIIWYSITAILGLIVISNNLFKLNLEINRIEFTLYFMLLVIAFSLLSKLIPISESAKKELEYLKNRKTPTTIFGLKPKIFFIILFCIMSAFAILSII